MSMSGNAPILRASIFEPFLLVAREIGAPVEKHLRSVQLPVLARDEPDMLLPEVPCWRFLDRVARSEGMETYGLNSASAIEHPELSSLRPLISGSGDLNELLRKFCSAAPLVSNSVNYSLRRVGNAMWFTNQGRRLLRHDIHAQLFQVLGMIQLVQLTAGSTWRPTDIHFSTPRSPAIENAPEINPSRIHFEQAHPAISFPSHLLAKSIARPVDDSRPVASIPASFGQQLSRLLSPYLDSGVYISKPVAAEITGLSTRTLQRRLANDGTCFSQVIQQTRHQKACAMLVESHLKLIDIALMLGYGDAPSFTRAFRRWSGVSPNEYRRQMVQN